MAKRRYKNQPGYVLFQNRWHNEKRLRERLDEEREVVTVEREEVEPEFRDPTVYVQARWKSRKKKSRLAEIQLELRGSFADEDDVSEAALDRIEDIMGTRGMEAGASPGFSVEGVSIGRPTTRTVAYFYRPEHGRLGSNLRGW